MHHIKAAGMDPIFSFGHREEKAFTSFHRRAGKDDLLYLFILQCSNGYRCSSIGFTCTGGTDSEDNIILLSLLHQLLLVGRSGSHGFSVGTKYQHFVRILLSEVINGFGIIAAKHPVRNSSGSCGHFVPGKKWSGWSFPLLIQFVRGAAQFELLPRKGSSAGEFLFEDVELTVVYTKNSIGFTVSRLIIVSVNALPVLNGSVSFVGFGVEESLVSQPAKGGTGLFCVIPLGEACPFLSHSLVVSNITLNIVSS